MITVTDSVLDSASSTKAVGIQCKSVRREYESDNTTITALEDVSVDVRPGEFVSLLGPSGCGKSTLLRLVAGLEPATSGEVTIDGDVVTEPHPELGMVFQDDLLMPWRNVLDNIMLQATIRRDNGPDMRAKALDLINQVGLTGFENKYPRQLSGGMRQRVGICRALLHSPRLLLMDEPFASLDAITRDQMSVDLADLASRLSMTVLFVTHSISEAVFLSDRVFVMSDRPGRIAAELDIDLPRPRRLHIRQTPEFVRYVGEVTTVFEQLGILQDRQSSNLPSKDPR